MDIHNSIDDSVDGIQQIAIALRRFNLRAEQLHTAIFFKDIDGAIKLLHVGGHNAPLSETTISEKYVWVSPNLDELNQKFLQTLCAMISRTLPQLPYGFGGEDVTFDPLGKMMHPADSKPIGFTCATFVLAIFESTGIKIIDRDSWSKTAVDKKWQIQICQQLEDIEGITDYTKKQREKITGGASRYRPDFVVAATATPEPPHTKEFLKIPANTLRFATNSIISRLL